MIATGIVERISPHRMKSSISWPTMPGISKSAITAHGSGPASRSSMPSAPFAAVVTS
jgi:hypothetical protein